MNKKSESNNTASDSINYMEICETVIKEAERFGKSFSYKEQDINDMEEILQSFYEYIQQVHSDEKNIWNVAVMWGIYLGQTIIENSNCTSQNEWKWKLEDNLPIIFKNDSYKMNPITKVYKRLLNGPEDNVKSFYDVAIAITNGNFNTSKNIKRNDSHNET